MTQGEYNFGGVISLTPGFSPVLKPHTDASRFNGFPCDCEAVDTALMFRRREITGLKPGANEKLIDGPLK